MAGVVHEDVDAPLVGEDRLDGGVDGVLGGDVELDGAEVDSALRRVALGLGGLGGVASGAVAHPRVDGVTRVGERPRAQRPEPARRSGDDDDLVHG